MPPRKRNTKRKISRKSTKTAGKATQASVLAQLRAKYPAASTTDIYRRQSWEMFAGKLAEAYNQQTMLFIVTVNPDILELRETIEGEFPCKICSPTEGLYFGGFNYITRG